MHPSDCFTLSGPLRWHEFDGEWVVFSTATGALRHLDTLTAAVLAILEEAPAPAALVAQQVSAATEVALTDDMVSGIMALLDDLQRSGFLECRTL